jgi:lysophospholipase L1-like esterase
MNKRLLGCLVLGVALAAAAGIGEAALRVLSTHWLRVYDVEMWQYARRIKLVSPDAAIVEEQRPNASALLMGARVRTEAHGFRLPDPATEMRRRPGDRQVVAVGDSLTFGWGDPEGETYPDQLERLLNARCQPGREAGGRGVTVHNAGIGNCNTTMELARYRMRIRQLHPDWVIVGFSFNDGEPDAVPSTNPFLWHSALIALTSARLQKQTESRLRDYNSYYVGLYREGLPAWERCKQAIRDWGAMLRADGIPGTMFVMPELHDPHNPGIAEAFSRVAAVARASGFEIIDPAPDFPAGQGEKFWEGYWVSHEDAHPNGRAQAIFARALARSRYACGRGAAGAPQSVGSGPVSAASR